MNRTELLKNFFVGTHYYRAPSPPPEEWDEDLANCRKLGFDFVQVRVFWRWHEREEGVYYWQDLDELMAKAAAAGCRVVFQINLENAPEYVFEKYDGYRIDIRGIRIWPSCNAAFYVGGWIPCFDNPEVMSAGLRFVEALVKRYQNDPTLAFYHAWNEPRCRPLGECTCRHSIASYREWLQKRFGTIEKLNEFSGKCWGSFEQVDAARDTSDFLDMHLWRQWGASRVEWRVRQVTEVLHRLDPSRAVISHVGMASVIQDPLGDISDDIAMSEVTDLYGCSYPVRLCQEYLSFMLLDWLRYVGRGKFANYEVYPSLGSYFPEIPGGLVEQWMWASLACGASGLCFWQYKKERLGVEINDAGMVETDGSFNETTMAIARSMQEISRLAGEIPSWQVPRAKVALCYDLQSDLLDRLKFTVAREGDNSQQYGLRCRVPGGYPYKGDLQGLYHLLWMKGYSCDFTTPRRWSDDLRNYPVVILPCFQVMDEERKAALLSYVRNGGILIVDAAFGRRGANTMLQPSRPGSQLVSELGFRESGCIELNNSKWRLEFTDGLQATAEFSRGEFKVTGSNAEVLARWENNQAPAVVRSRLGRGQVIAVGAYMGLQSFGDHDSVYQETWDSLGFNLAPGDFAPWSKFLGKVLAEAGIAPENLCGDGFLEKQIVKPDGKVLHFLFRRFGGDRRLTAEEWQAVSYPGGRQLLSLDNVKIFED